MIISSAEISVSCQQVLVLHVVSIGQHCTFAFDLLGAELVLHPVGDGHFFGLQILQLIGQVAPANGECFGCCVYTVDTRDTHLSALLHLNEVSCPVQSVALLKCSCIQPMHLSWFAAEVSLVEVTVNGQGILLLPLIGTLLTAAHLSLMSINQHLSPQLTLMEGRDSS